MATLKPGIAILWGLVIGLIIVAACYFLKVNPIYSGINSLVAKANVLLGSSSLSGFVNKNWPTLASISVMAIPLVYTSIKGWMQKKELEKQLKTAQDLALLEQQKAAVKASEMASKLEAYDKDTTADELQKQLSQLSTSKESLENQILKLQGQIEQQKALPTQIVNELWQASGGKVQVIGGETVKVIEMVRTITK